MPLYYNDEGEICREFPIGFIAVQTETQRPYTGSAYSSGAKVFKTKNLAKSAITAMHTSKEYEYYEVYYKKPLYGLPFTTGQVNK